MNNELEKKSQELEQTLAKQLELLKKDSQDWLKVGGIVLVAGLVTYGVVKATKKKKENKTEKALEILAKEGLLTPEIEEKLKKPTKSNFWPSLTQKLLLVGIAVAKEKFLMNLLNPTSNTLESPANNKESKTEFKG
jgi:hypothetical protein